MRVGSNAGGRHGTHDGLGQPQHQPDQGKIPIHRLEHDVEGGRKHRHRRVHHDDADDAYPKQTVTGADVGRSLPDLGRSCTDVGRSCAEAGRPSPEVGRSRADGDESRTDVGRSWSDVGPSLCGGDSSLGPSSDGIGPAATEGMSAEYASDASLVVSDDGAATSGSVL